MLRYAMTRSPDGHRKDGTRRMFSYSMSDVQLPLVTENIRHEFISDDSRLVLNFGDGSRLTAVWPHDESETEPHGFFYLETASGAQPRRPKDVLASFPRIGVIPSPSPIEHIETLLNMEYVRRNEDGRLASRHFRNQLYYLKTEPPEDRTYQEFVAYVDEWTPELTLLNVRARLGTKERELDVFYREAGSRKEKELVWAGDGVQIWLQLLFHLYRCRYDPIIVLDEPDVYLHADLQRRLVRVLETHNAQTLLATHSAEVLGEAPAESVMWVDRARRHAVRAPEGATLEELSGALGSQFNMRLARALRAKVALFFEGDDHRLLRNVARTVGAYRLADESGIAVVPIGGFSNWDKIEPFVWLVDRLLDRAVQGYVVLDRDYRPEPVTQAIERKLASIGLSVHVWKRKELENYLLVPEAVARISTAPAAWIEKTLEKCSAGLESTVFARELDEALRYELSQTRNRVTVTEAFKVSFDERWRDAQRRIHSCPAKLLLSRLNDELVAAGFRSVSAFGVAKAMTSAEVPEELKSVLHEIEQLATGASQSAAS